MNRQRASHLGMYSSNINDYASTYRHFGGILRVEE